MKIHILKYLVAIGRSFFPPQMAMGKEKKRIIGQLFFNSYLLSHPQVGALLLILQMSSLRLRC